MSSDPVRRAAISQVDEATAALVRVEGQRTRGSALGVALAERLHRNPSDVHDLSERFSRPLWERIIAVAGGADPSEIARPFTPYAGPGRRTVARRLATAATAIRELDDHASAPRSDWQQWLVDHRDPSRAPLDVEARRLAVARDAFTNDAGRAPPGCWVDEPIGSVRRPKLEGEPHLVAARLVVALGLGECLWCGSAVDASVRRGRHARAPMYCKRHAGTASTLRANHRDLMHAALEAAA